MNRESCITKIYMYIVAGSFLAVLSLLFVLNLVNTCYVTLMEKVYFTRDSLWKNLLLLLSFAVLCLLLAVFRVGKRLEKAEENRGALFQGLQAMLLIFLLGAGLFWVCSTQFLSWADSKDVQDAALALRAGDLSPFVPGGYVDVYPNQLGLVMVQYLVLGFTGQLGNVFWQVVNVFALVWFFAEVLTLEKLWGFSETERVLTAVAAFCYLPLLFYTSFVYGTLPGLAFAMAALRRETAFLRSGKKKDMVLAGLWIALAITMKNNYLIFLMGMLIYGVFCAAGRREIKRLVVVPVLVCSTLLVSAGITATARSLTGQELAEGVSPLAFVAMGLQEGERAPGWFNEYNRSTYLESGFDRDRQAQVALEEIREQLSFYRQEPYEGAVFLVKKIASQWSEPACQSLWLMRGSRKEQIPEFAEVLISEGGRNKFSRLFDKVQIFLLLGVVLYLFFGGRRNGYCDSLLPGMIVVGGFLFHLAWEAKAQYAISYLALLIPYAASGFYLLIRCLEGLIKRCRAFVGERQKKEGTKERRARETVTREQGAVGVKFLLGILAAVLLMTGVLAQSGVLGQLWTDNAVYVEYVQSNS